MTDSPLSDHSLDFIVVLMPLSALMLVCQANPYNALVIRGILGAVAALVYAALGAADVALTEALVGTMLTITLYAVAVRSSLVMRLGILQIDAYDGQTQNTRPEEMKQDAQAGDDRPEASEQGGQPDDPSILKPPTAMEPPTPVNSTALQELDSVRGPRNPEHRFEDLIDHLRGVLKTRYMRLECVTYPDEQALQQALIDKDVHGTCVQLGRSPLGAPHCPILPHPDTLTRVSNTDQQADILLTVRIDRLYNILSAELPPSDAVITYAKTPDTPALAATVLNPKSRELAEE